MSEFKKNNNLIEEQLLKNNNYKNENNNIKTIKFNNNKNNEEKKINDDLIKDKNKKISSNKENLSKKNKNTQRFIDMFLKRASKDSLKAELNKVLTDSQSLPFYLFTKHPWNLWVAGFLLFIGCIGFTCTIYIFYNHSLYHKSLILLNIFFYYLSFFIIYSGEIEYFRIDRKKEFISKIKKNIFGSKTQYLFKFDQIDYIEIIMKGIKKFNDDHRKYFIRIYNKDKKIKCIEFGSTWYWETIKFKYQICLAMIKNIIKINVPKYYIKDESEYFNYVY